MRDMRPIYFCFLATVILAVAGCTEMRVEGDAKVFQSSAVGSIIRTVIGVGLIGLGAMAFAGGVLPDRKPKKRTAKPSEKLSSGQRVGLALFGGAMAFMGLVLAGAPLLFPSKLHVTVYPDRVEMASTYSQTGGKEVVVPFANLASVELRDEPNVVGKFKTFLVFTRKNGNVIRQDAGNNERKAVDTIRQALADFGTRAPAVIDETTAAANSAPARPRPGFGQPGNLPTEPEPVPAPESSAVPVGVPETVDEKKVASTAQEYVLKRYKITIPIPADHSIVGPDAIVNVGSKLKACYAGSWSIVTVVGLNSDGTITCNWDSYPTYTYKMMREDLIAANESGTSAPAEVPSSQYSLKRYKISIPVPTGYAVVDAASDVKVGMKLGACYAGRWESVTVVAINNDGTITCNWDNYPSFTYRMMREDLTMGKQDAR